MCPMLNGIYAGQRCKCATFIISDFMLDLIFYLISNLTYKSIILIIVYGMHTDIYI